MTAVCENCSIVFEVKKYKNPKYCSRKCSNIKNNILHPRLKKQKLCRSCFAPIKRYLVRCADCKVKFPSKTGPKNIGTQIQQLLNAGLKPAEIAEKLGCVLSTITYHAKRLGQDVQVRPTYNWGEINVFHNSGYSLAECMEKFGFCRASWHKARIRGEVITRLEAKGLSLDVQLVAGRVQGRHNIKKKLLRAGLLEKKCYSCGIVEWKGKPLAFNLDHKDGDKLNWALENLQMICPNCDSQQDTFAGKNIKRLREKKNLNSQFGQSAGQLLLKE